MGKCRSCGHNLSKHTTVNEDPKGAKPSENDLSVCFGCGALSKFDEQLNLVPLTPEELIALDAENPETSDLLIRTRELIYNKDLT